MDWAWPEGATDWVALKDVPGFSVSPVTPPVPPTGIAGGLVVPAAAEQELWRGHPSQVLNLSIYLFWTAILIIVAAAVVALVVAEECSQEWGLIIVGVVALPALIQGIVAWLHLRAIEYVVSTQRVRIVSGIFSKDIQEIELFRVKDTMVHQSFFLRLFGLGTITILSGDERQPRLILSGIPRAIELREKLRQEVMTLRQRFGVRELDVM
jgi:uncharacterized membrane protein YdbT with pleckstrin-like domain